LGGFAALSLWGGGCWRRTAALGAYPVVLNGGGNAAIEALRYGAAVSTPAEAAAVIEASDVPEPPTAPLYQFHITKAVGYERVIKKYTTLKFPRRPQAADAMIKYINS